MLHHRRLACVALFFGLPGCASPPPVVDEHAHTHTATVSVTTNGLLPDPVVHIPTFATVVWRNQLATPVSIEVIAATCRQCETVMGFGQTDAGARSVAVAPGGIATLCFHDVGSFAFTARGGNFVHDGVIQVGGTP